MSYKTIERNKAILAIGTGDVSIQNIAMYEELERFNWVHVKRINGIFEEIGLTYSGEQLFKQIQKSNLV